MKSFILLLLALTSPLVRADTAAPTPGVAYNEPYQTGLVERALQMKKLKLDPKPEGKKIERTEIFIYDVFSDGDPWPRIAEKLHARTQPEVVRRELLFHNGETWNPAQIEETERNLRAYLTLSVAEIVAARGSDADHVVAVVVTKDLWSLRLDWDFTYADSTLEQLSLELAEFNLGGWNRKLGLTYSQDLDTYAPGLEFVEPRLLGSRVAVSEQGSVIFNRGTQAVEGGTETISIGQPLYSLSTEWAWNTSLNYRKDIFRHFVGATLDNVLDPTTNEVLPYSFGEDLVDAVASLTRSFGRDTKQDVSFGWRGFSHNYTLPTVSYAVRPQTLLDFQNTLMPRSESAGMAFISYHLYTPEFIQLEDINSFALTEDFKLGPDLSLEARLADPGFGFTSSFFQPLGQASYTWRLDDDLLIVRSAASARHEPGILPSEDWVNETASAELQNISPRFEWFRLHADTMLIRRQNDLNHTFNFLGGDTLLRGYPSGFFAGPNLWTGNLELRTLPVEYHTVYVGGVAFTDFGSAFTGPSTFQVYSSVGAGLRIVFPQFNRAALRIDAGIPLQTVPGVSPISIVAKFGQAFQ